MGVLFICHSFGAWRRCNRYSAEQLCGSELLVNTYELPSLFLRNRSIGKPVYYVAGDWWKVRLARRVPGRFHHTALYHTAAVRYPAGLEESGASKGWGTAGRENTDAERNR